MLVSFLKKEIKSFAAAFAGMFLLLKEKHFLIHLLACLVVFVAGVILKVNYKDWISLVLCCGLVLGLEAVNTAIEKLCNHVTPNLHNDIKQIKDIAAAAVLIAAMVSLCVAGILLSKYAFS